MADSWSLTSKLSLAFFITSFLSLVALVWWGYTIYQSESTEQRASPGVVQAYYVLTMVVVGILTIFCLVMMMINQIILQKKSVDIVIKVIKLKIKIANFE